MLQLTAKLTELNEDGLFLVHLLENNRYSTIGDIVRMDKFSSVSLKSTITWEARYRKVNGGGLPLTAAQEKHIKNVRRVYGETDRTLYGFYPVEQLYQRGNRCIGCVMNGSQNWADKPVMNHQHPEQLSGGTHTDQINRLGRYFRWYLEKGYFEPIKPREISTIEKMCFDALFETTGKTI